MSGTTIPSLPTEPAVARTDYAISQAGNGPNATYKVAYSTVFAAMNKGDITTALGYTPISSSGGTFTGGVAISAGSFSVASGTVTFGAAGASAATLTLNSLNGTNTVVSQAGGVAQFAWGVSGANYALTLYSGGSPTSLGMTMSGTDGTVTFGSSVTVATALTTTAGTLRVGGVSGSSGTPTVSLFSKTAAKGVVTLTTADNAGNTTTALTVAAQSGARTYTIPDAGGNATVLMTGATMSSAGLTGANVPLTGLRNPNGTTIDATGSSSTFAVASTVGTSLNIAGANAKSATITSDAIVEYTMPSTYIAGTSFNTTVNAKIAGTGTAGTKTLVVKAYAVATDGSQGSNLGPATQNMTTSNADYTFAITGTSVTPGSRVLMEIEAVLQETGGSNNINTQINSIRVGT